MHENWKPPKVKTNVNGGRGMGGGGKYDRSRSRISWASVPTEIIGQFVQEMCGEGYAIILSQTSDGGALSISVLMGNDKLQDWPHSLEDLLQLVGWCHENLTSD